MRLHLPTKIIFGLLAALVIVAVIYIVAEYPKLKNSSSQTPPATGEIVLDYPKENTLVVSPLTIMGKAKGNWFFEASFPAHLLDQDGSELGAAAMRAKGDWMTEDFVDFEGSITFSQPKGRQGTLVLENDNPSGLTQNHKEFRVLVKFNPLAVENE